MQVQLGNKCIVRQTRNCGLVRLCNHAHAQPETCASCTCTHVCMHAPTHATYTCTDARRRTPAAALPAAVALHHIDPRPSCRIDRALNIHTGPWLAQRSSTRQPGSMRNILCLLEGLVKPRSRQTKLIGSTQMIRTGMQQKKIQNPRDTSVD